MIEIQLSLFNLHTPATNTVAIKLCIANACTNSIGALFRAHEKFLQSKQVRFNPQKTLFMDSPNCKIFFVVRFSWLGCLHIFVYIADQQTNEHNDVCKNRMW